MPELTGGSERVNLGAGYVIVAPGLRGRADRVIAAPGDVRARDAAKPLLNDVLATNGMTTVANIEIAATPVPGAGVVAELRDARGDDALLLEVPDLGPTAGQVVLAVDEAGALSWHFPMEANRIQPPDMRGAGEKKRFLIRSRVAPTPPAGAARDRALFGDIGRKLLKVLVYPVTDLLVGAPVAAIAESWEKANRAYGLRDFTPDNYQQPKGAALAGADLDRLAQGRALLFIHGTFSTAHGAFCDLPPDFMTELHQRYDGRVFAFNHYSMSHDPAQNVRWFLDALGPMSATALDLDIVCHSRGGLVARALAEGKAAFDLDVGRANVHRVAFVGVPNHGTLLADPDHMVEMIDRMTTALNLFPPGGVADIFEGILIGVKIIGHGALNGLSGLHSMHPTGAFMKKLNRGGRTDPQYFAVSANFEPTDPGMRSIVGRAADTVVDRVFEDAENDLVVPELGVYAENGCDSFPIPADRCLRIPGTAGVMHTSMFGHPELVAQLKGWLKP